MTSLLPELLLSRTGGVWNNLTHSLNYLLNVFNYFYEVSFPTSFAVLWFVYNGSFLGYGSSREEESKMGRVFLDHPGGIRIYSCASCDTPLTNRSELVSTVSTMWLKLCRSTIKFKWCSYIIDAMATCVPMLLCHNVSICTHVHSSLSLSLSHTHTPTPTCSTHFCIHDIDSCSSSHRFE